MDKMSCSEKRRIDTVSVCFGMHFSFNRYI